MTGHIREPLNKDQTMQSVTIYTKATCGYCQRAKVLLTRKNVPFTEIPVDGDATRQQEMSQRAGGGWTVPQIFIGAQRRPPCPGARGQARRAPERLTGT